MVLLAFELGQEDGKSRHEPSRAGYSGYSDQECWEKGRGRDADCRPDRCVRVPGRFLATVAVLVQDLRGIGAMQPLQPLKASLEGAATLVREFY